MNTFKFVMYDIRHGTFRCKRITYLLIVCILQCMLVQIQLDNILYFAERSGYADCRYGLREVILSFFGGCDPLLKNKTGAFPYSWFAVYICVLFTTFDYMYSDLTQLGIQVLSRSGSRMKWWLSKCLWNIITIVIGYILMITVCVIFCVMINVPLELKDNTVMDMYLSTQTSCYTANASFGMELSKTMLLICSPLIIMVTLSMLQMTLSLIIKPVISMWLMIGLLVMAVITDKLLAFTRIGMPLYSSAFYQEGYSSAAGIIICMIIFIASALAGAVIFSRTDILPVRGEK